MKLKFYCLAIALFSFFCSSAETPKGKVTSNVDFGAGDVTIDGAIATASPYYQGQKEVAIYKLTLVKETGAANGISDITFEFTTTAANLLLTNAKLYSSTDAVWNGVSNETFLANGTIGAHVVFTGLSIDLGGSGTAATVNLYLVADVLTTATVAATFKVGVPNGNVLDTNNGAGVNVGGGDDITGNITIAAPTATITEVTGGVATSLIGGVQDQALIGLQVVTNGGQNLNPLNFTINQNTSTLLQNFKLIASNTSTYDPNGTQVGGVAGVVPGATTTITFSTNVAVDNTKTWYFFLQADVLQTVTGAPASETTTYVSSTASPGSATGTFTEAIPLVAATASLDAAGITGLPAATILASTANAALFAFKASSTGIQDMTSVKISMADPGTNVGNMRLIVSNSSAYSTSLVTSPPVGTNSYGPSTWGTGTVDFAITEPISSTARYFYLVGDVSASANAAFQASLASANVTIASTKTLTPDPILGTAHTLAQPTASVDMVGITGLNSNPIIAGTTNAGVFAFRATSNSTQSLTAVKITMADPSTNISNIRLVASNSSTYSTSLVTAPPGGTTVYGPATWGSGTVDFTVTESITTSPKYFYVVINTAVSANTTFQASLNAADFTVSGSKSFSGDPLTGTNYNINPPTATLSVAGITNLAASPLIGGTNDKAVVGFSLSSNGTQNLSAINFTVTSTNGVDNYTGYELIRSDNADFSTGTKTVVANLSGTGSFTGATGGGSSLTANLASARTIAGTDYYFLVLDVKPSVLTTTLAPINFVVNSLSLDYGGSANLNASSKSYDLAAPTATLSAGVTNLAPSPLVGGSTDRAVIGFSLASNGTQVLSSVTFTVTSTANVDDYVGYELIRSDNADFSLGTKTVVANLSGTGSFTGNTGGGSSLVATLATPRTISSSEYYFLVVDVKNTVAATAGTPIHFAVSSLGLDFGSSASLGLATTNYDLDAPEATVSIAGISNLAATPIVGGSTNRAVLGFKLTSDGAQDFSGADFTIASPNGTDDFSSIQVIASTSGDFTTGTKTVVANQSGVGTINTTPGGTSIDVTFNAPRAVNPAEFYFLVVTVGTNVPTTSSSAVTFSIAGLDLAPGTSTSLAAADRATDYQQLTATVLANNGALAASVTGRNTNNPIFGFRAKTNGTQSITKVEFSINSSTAASLASILASIQLKDDGTNATYSGAGSAAGSVNITGTAPNYTLTFDLTGTPIALSGADKYFYLVADVPAAALATSSVQVDLTDVDVNFGVPSSLAGITRTFDVVALTATVLANNGSLSASVIGGNTNNAIYGFRVKTNGTQSLTKVEFTLNSSTAASLASILTSIQLKDDGTNATYSGTGSVAGAVNVTGSAPNYTLTFDLTGTPIVLSGADKYFYLTANVPATALSVAGVSPTLTDIDTDFGYNSSLAAGFNRSFNVDQLTATINTNNGALSAALTGGSTNNPIFGFRVKTNGTQSLTNIAFTVNTSSAPSLASILSTLVLKDDGTNATYSGAGTPRGTVNVTGTAPNYTLTFDLSLSPVALSGADKYFYLVSNVPGSAPATNNVQVALSNVSTNAGYPSSIAGFNRTFNVTALTATVAQVTGGPVLTATSPLEAGTATRALYGFTIKSNGTQNLTSVTMSFANQPNGLTNFALYKGTAGSVGSSVATAADPAGTSITFAPAQSIPASDDYYYLVADVKGSANVTSNNITISLDPTTTDITVSAGFKSTSAFVGTAYTFTSSSQTVLADNDGETTPINFAIYSTKTATSGLTAANAQRLYRFTISGSDNDTQATNIRQIVFSVTKTENIATLALLNASAGNTNFSEVAVTGTGTQNISFGTNTSTILSVADNASVTIDIYATFRSTVIDSDQIIFSFVSAGTDGVASGISGAQGAFSSDVGENNITVVATEMRITTLSLADVVITKANPNQDFKVRAQATDANGNVDTGKTSTADFDALNPNPTTENVSPSASNQSWSNGQVEWTVALAPADFYDLQVHDDGGLTNAVVVDFQIESLGTTISPMDLTACMVGSANVYSTLPNLVLSESDQGDMSGGSNLTFLLFLPEGWVFDTSVLTPTTSFTAGQNVTAISFDKYIGNTIAKFIYSVTGTNKVDQITIGGLKVKNVSMTSGAGTIFRSGTGQIIGADDSKVLGTLTVSAAVAADFTVDESPNEAAVSPTQTNFSIYSAPIILNGEVPIGNAVTTGTVFTGSGVSYKFIGNPINANRYVFNPSTLNVGTYPITFTYTDPGTGCISTATKNFQVYSSAINGLASEYCADNNSVQSISVNPTFVPTNYTATGEFAISFSSVKYVTDVVNNGTSLTITVPSHGLAAGSNYQVFIGYGLTGPDAPYGYVYNTFTLSNVTTNTFDINATVTGTWDRSYGYLYLQNPTVTSIVNNGTSLTITAPNHGLKNGAAPYLSISGMSIDGGVNNYFYGYYTISGVTTNTFTVNVTATGLWTSAYVGIFDYKITSFSPNMAGNLNTNLAGAQFYYVGYFITYDLCTSPPFTCSQTYNYQYVQINQLPNTEFSGLNSDYCVNNAPVTLTGANPTFDGNYTVSPNFGITNASDHTAQFAPAALGITPEGTITITYTFTDSKGCTNLTQKTTKVHSLPVVDAGANVDICEGSAGMIGGAPTADGVFNSPYIYSWNNSGSLDNSTISNPKASPTINTTYTVTVTDKYGCVNTDNTTVTVFTPVVVNASAQASICAGDANGFNIIASSITGAVTTGSWASSDAGGSFLDNGNSASTAFGVAEKFIPSQTSGTLTLTLTSTDPTGPCLPEYETITVTVNPKAVVNNNGPYEYCATSTNMLVNGAVTLASAPYTSVQWSSSNGTGTFENANLPTTRYIPSNPELLSGATINITLTALDSDGGGPCIDVSQPTTLKVSPRPIVSAGTDREICASTVFENGIDLALSGSVNVPGETLTATWSGGTGTFVGGVNNANTTYRPNNSTLTTTLIETLTLTSSDPATACGPESDQVQVTIYQVPDAPIANQPAPICVGGTVEQLTALGTNLKWWTQIDLSKTITNAPSVSAGIGSPISTGLNSNVEIAKFFYVNQTLNQSPALPAGCVSPPTAVEVVINPLPQPDFDITKFCDKDFTEFRDLSQLNFTNGKSGTIDRYEWDFKDGTKINDLGSVTVSGSSNTTGTHKDPNHQFPGVGTYEVALKVTTSNGCSNTKVSSASTFGQTHANQPLRIGRIPVAKFSHKFVCNGDDTQFEYDQNANIAAHPETTIWAWDFGDPTSSTNSSLSVNPIHKFTATGTFNVGLTLTTGLGCSASTTKSIFILPYQNNLVNGYEQKFETNSHGWVHEGLAVDFSNLLVVSVPDSWQPIDLTGLTIRAPKNDQYAFITSGAPNPSLPTTRTYGLNERSVLYTPCVNLTTLQRPAMSFDYWRDMDDKDGVYVEYSTDGGVTWLRLGGELNPNWYTNSSVSGLATQPDVVYKQSVGQAVDQFGFSGSSIDPLVADPLEWKSAKYSLDALAANAKMRFRFVFGSNGDISDKMGFILDNFKLGSRNRKVLVENFTNFEQTTNNANFVSFRSGLINTEVLKLQYHTSLLKEDPDNLKNPVDLNARAAFYGLTNQTDVIPKAFIDGQSATDGFFTSANPPWAESIFSSQTLSVSPVAMTVNKIAGDDEELKVNVSVTPNSTITIGNPVLIVAVIEKQVGSEQYVVRKLLPSAAGFPITLTQGVTITKDFSWYVNIEGIDVSELAVVAFVQDLESKEVYQTDADLSNLNLPKAVTAVDDEGVGANRLFSVYPNPSDKELVVELAQEYQNRVELQVFDQMGKHVDGSFFEKGDRQKTINTSNFAGGVYVVKVNTPKGMLMKKVVVTHSH